MLDFWKNPMLDFCKKIQYWTLMLAGHKHICPTCDVNVQLMLGFYGHVNFNLKVELTWKLNVGPTLDIWKNPMLDFWKKIQYWILMLAGHQHKHICPTCDINVQLMLGIYVHVNFNS